MFWGRKKAPVEKAKPIQVNPLHADKIVRQIIKKTNWHGKIDSNDIVNKWKKESMDSGISESSFLVAMDILRDIKDISHTQKSCCGHCGATPKKKRYTDAYSDREIDENEELFTNSKKRTKEEPEKHDQPHLKKVKGHDDEEDQDEEDEDDQPYYRRSTKFCLCPCAHCAFEEKQVSADVCYQGELISQQLSERVKKHLNALVESTPVDKYDWHPGSNQQVLDIIHPSLYCYSKKYSKFNDENAKQLEKQMEKVETQWLPTDFEIQDGKAVPLSYINNIDPRNQKELQDTICDVLSCFIDPVKEFVPTLNEKKVQVIVKAANVIVTPEQGFYPGGTWHTEGDSENIVATGIYYYQCENVKESVLEFRESLDEEDFYEIEQDNVEEAWSSYGIHDGDLLVKHLGGVKTTEGKCIVFPNEKQHRVKHFFPKDPTKNATRKILVFFFVNPEKPIVSTSQIDNQRRDVTISNAMPLAKKITFPVLVEKVIPFLPLMTRKQAEEERVKLMDHRKYKKTQDNEEFERPFSLCEH